MPMFAKFHVFFETNNINIGVANAYLAPLVPTAMVSVFGGFARFSTPASQQRCLGSVTLRFKPAGHFKAGRVLRPPRFKLGEIESGLLSQSVPGPFFSAEVVLMELRPR